MRFTKYGQAQAQAEHVPESDPIGGATAHMAACQYDAGREIILTGVDFSGRRFTKTAKSIYGAYCTMLAVSGLRNAWLIDNGKRRLIITR